MNIAIDGPAGAGKSTVAQQVAKRLHLLYIDTGAMYRALTYIALTRGCPLTEEHQLRRLLDDIQIELMSGENGQTVYVNGRDVTREIRTTEVTNHVSLVAAYPSIRERMVELQRNMAEKKSVVMDGRDIGTNVLPNADLKVFLTASHEERARRRYQELLERGIRANQSQLGLDIAERDRKDSQREIAPLKQAEDAILFDSTGLTIDQVVDRIVALYHEMKERA